MNLGKPRGAAMGIAVRARKIEQQPWNASPTLTPFGHRHWLSFSLSLIILMSLSVTYRLLWPHLMTRNVHIRTAPFRDETFLNYSAINPAHFQEQRKLRWLLEKNDGGKLSIRDVLYNSYRSAPTFSLANSYTRGNVEANVPGITGVRTTVRRRSSEHTWLVPLTNPRFQPYIQKFYSLANDWLDEGDSNPLVMQDLLRSVKETSERRSSSTPISSHELLSNATSRFRSCAVVGNSGILLNSSHGEEIDSHEIVIRLNNAGITPHEKDVGCKTTLAFMNSNILHECSRREACFCHDSYGDEVPIVLYLCQVQHLMDVAMCGSHHKSPLLVTNSRLDTLCARIVKWYSVKNFVESLGRRPQEWENAHDSFFFHYSSGMQAVVVALGICDSVSLFGFGKSPTAKHHYHTAQKQELAIHDYVAEQKFYGDLVLNRTPPFLSQAGFSIPPVQIFY